MGPERNWHRYSLYRATILFIEVCNFIITFAPCTQYITDFLKTKAKMLKEYFSFDIEEVRNCVTSSTNELAQC